MHLKEGVLKLVIGNKNYSSWSLRAWLLLSVHELPFEEVPIALGRDDTSALLARYTEAGKVPVLLDDDLTVWDSMAICEYVSEQYLSGGGWPSGARARAEARSCSAEMHSGLPEIRGQLPMNCRATGRKVPLNAALEKELARIDRIWSRCRGTYAGADPWLFGQFSIADCMFAPVALRFKTYGIELSKTATHYMELVLDNEKVRLWVAQAGMEFEIIEMAEVGGITG